MSSHYILLSLFVLFLSIVLHRIQYYSVHDLVRYLYLQLAYFLHHLDALGLQETLSHQVSSSATEIYTISTDALTRFCHLTDQYAPAVCNYISLDHSLSYISFFISTTLALELTVTLVLVLYLLYFTFTPLNYFRGVHDVPGASLKQLPKIAGQCPPPYPNAWYQLIYSDELQPGETLSIDALGNRFAVYRGDDKEKKVSVLDAYCTHMGANIALGGKVMGNCIECPFHGWRFDGDSGKCVNIAYSSNKVIPANAKVRKWPSVEMNGSVYIWFHAANAPPDWSLFPAPSQEHNGYWHGRSEHHVAVHIQDVPENGADTAHLFYLHPTFIIEWIGKIFRISHDWNTAWIPNGKEKHRAYCKLEHNVVLFNRWKIPGSYVLVNVNMIGPGIVYIHFQSLAGQVYAIQSVTPTEPHLQRCRHDIWGSWTVPRPLAKLALLSIVTQFERDIRMWNHKTHQHRPMLVKDDGKIQQFRRWFSQFYCEESYKQLEQDSRAATCNPNLLSDW